MTTQQISIGSEVRTSDGHAIGNVTKLIVAPDDQRLTAFVADRGIVDQGRVVEMTEVVAIHEGLVTLSLTAAQAEHLAGFAQHRFVSVPGTNDSWFRIGPGQGDMSGTGGGALFEMPLPIDAEMRTVGPLDGGEVALGHGTDVVDKLGNRIGQVDEIRMTDSGKIAGFVVRQGLVFHHDVYVPIEWVAGVTHDHVRLNVLEEDVHASKA